MARALLHHAGKRTRVIAVDFCLPMLRQAVDPGRRLRPLAVGADVQNLPFPGAIFDLVTVSFATRNINISRDILRDTFREFHRVLRPGGVLVNVETSQPRSRAVRGLFHAFIKAVVKPVGSRISGYRPGYAYLASTIPRFYAPGDLAQILEEAGFSSLAWKRMLWGITAIHRGVKPGSGAEVV
jgi:demethylmenaquinone methyltransferase/2-methoxy-6-polyprenyl-1,4-benzoquinol methylase